MRLAFRQAAFDRGAGSAQQGERERVIQHSGTSLVQNLTGERAELLLQPSHPTRLQHVAALPDGGPAARPGPARQAAVQAVRFGKNGGHRVALAVGAKIEDDGVCLPLHCQTFCGR